jgi:uncharacterized protein (DUF779 family)
MAPNRSGSSDARAGPGRCARPGADRPLQQAPDRDPGGRFPAKISATPAAREAIRRLRAARGQGLVFVQSAGCCAGSVPMCFPAGEFILGDTDLLLGMIEDCPFYIDARTYQSWDTPQRPMALADPNTRCEKIGPGKDQDYALRGLAQGEGHHRGLRRKPAVATSLRLRW